jgi:hypothetical protein
LPGGECTLGGDPIPFFVIARFMRATQFRFLAGKLDRPDKPGDDEF